MRNVGIVMAKAWVVYLTLLTGLPALAAQVGVVVILDLTHSVYGEYPAHRESLIALNRRAAGGLLRSGEQLVVIPASPLYTENQGARLPIPLKPLFQGEEGGGRSLALRLEAALPKKTQPGFLTGLSRAFRMASRALGSLEAGCRVLLVYSDLEDHPHPALNPPFPGRPGRAARNSGPADRGQSPLRGSLAPASEGSWRPGPDPARRCPCARLGFTPGDSASV